jgi:hypothetical protein
MQFRYDFVGGKLDLSRFIKQINRHLVQYDELNYSFYVLGYKIQANIYMVDGSTKHIIKFFIAELQRDNDGEVNSYAAIRVTEDLRFKEFSDLIKYYSVPSTSGEFESSSVDEIVNILSSFIKIIYKINNLKAFL